MNIRSRRHRRVTVCDHSNLGEKRLLLKSPHFLCWFVSGHSHTLTCKVIFGFERNFSPVIQWYVNYDGKMEKMIPLQMESQQWVNVQSWSKTLHLSLCVDFWSRKLSSSWDTKDLKFFSWLRQEKRSFIEFLVTQRAIIKEVTLRHFNHTYTCMASNAVGNSSTTIKLKRKTGGISIFPAVFRFSCASS